MRIEQRLRELGVELPEPATPVAAYIPYTRSGNLIFISGQDCRVDGELKVPLKHKYPLNALLHWGDICFHFSLNPREVESLTQVSLTNMPISCIRFRDILVIGADTLMAAVAAPL